MRAPAAIRVARTLGLARELALSWAGATILTPRLDVPSRRALGLRFARRLLRTLGVAVASRGAPPARGGPLLVVANHVSWLDVYVLNAMLEARFVAKSETASWPLVGAVVRGFDAIQIVRGSFRDAYRVRGTVATVLRAGERVVVFPEATTTDGGTLGRFHPALFQAAIDAGVRVLPVALRYRRPDGSPAPEAAFVGEMTFAESLARVVGARALRAELTFLPVLETHGRTRRELAGLARELVRGRLGLPPAQVAAETPAPRFKVAV
jgi:1-acyl-sn-glycerol-3-phosphate acyltransferase